MVVQNISANGKETDLTFTIKAEDLNKTNFHQHRKRYEHVNGLSS